MGPGEDDFVVSGKESGPSITTQGAGGKLCGCFIFPLPPRLFVQGFLFLSHVPNSSVGTLWVRGRERGQALASKDTLDWDAAHARTDAEGHARTNAEGHTQIGRASCRERV